MEGHRDDSCLTMRTVDGQVMTYATANTLCINIGGGTHMLTSTQAVWGSAGAMDVSHWASPTVSFYIGASR